MRPPAHDPFEIEPYHFVLIWLLCASFALFGLAVLWEQGLLGAVFGLDRSRVTLVIAALVGAGSAHAVWHLVGCSRRLDAARATLRAERAAARAEPGAVVLAPPADPFVEAWRRDVARGEGRTREELLERYADRLRSPVELGWYLVDTTVRLGLLGTIIGFILIFTALSDLSFEAAEGLRALLVAMSGGMGTALFTTLAGLVGASALGVQYLVLGRAAEHLLGALAQLRAEREARERASRPAAAA